MVLWVDRDCRSGVVFFYGIGIESVEKMIFCGEIMSLLEYCFCWWFMKVEIGNYTIVSFFSLYCEIDVIMLYFLREKNVGRITLWQIELNNIWHM